MYSVSELKELKKKKTYADYAKNSKKNGTPKGAVSIITYSIIF